LRNFRRGKARRGDLVKQRLKQMMVGAIHQGDARVGPAKMFAEFQAAKPGAEHDHVKCLVLRHGII